MDFLVRNMATIIALLVVAAIVVGIILVMVKDKKNGTSPCGGGCKGCPNSQLCHKAQQSQIK